MHIQPEDIQHAFEQPYDAVMINLEISDQAVLEVCRLAKSRNIPVILDAGPARPFDRCWHLIIGS